MLLTANDVSDFVHVTKQDDAFILLQKNMCTEMDRHEWSIVKSPFEFSAEYTELKTAREFCYEILNLLGVQTYYKHSGLRLAIEIIKEPENQKAN